MKYRHKQTNTIINLSDYEEVKGTKKNWKPERREQYWFIGDKGTIFPTSWFDTKNDIFRYESLNCFELVQQAEAYRDYLLALGKVTRRINELNEGWEPDWSNEHQKKYMIEFYHQFYHQSQNKYRVVYWYFSQGALELPFIESEKIANQIISELTPELDIVRNLRG